jgi:cellulose/xylan binding protein with CBM9 domain
MFILKKAKKGFIIAFLLLPFCHTIAQNLQIESTQIEQQKKSATLNIPRISAKIVIDGELNEPQWQSAKKILINNITRPFDNIPSPINTEALLMEDGENFYLAFIAQDPDPSQIRAYLKDRDQSWGEDIVGIKIDTYNDQRTAYRFLVNPYGVQMDGIENEVTKRDSNSWDAIWDSYGKITDQGYIVEIALPLSILTFKENLAIQNWGIELLRFYPREQFLRLSNIYLDRANSCEICQLSVITGFAGAKQGDNLTIAPSLVSSISESLADNDQWQRSNNTDPSLDIRWGITPDILLNTTINPDFSTVETDAAQLDINNNFALFYEEKRPFFLDNADYFDSDYNLVYTRNINAPNYGGKLTGRYNDHSFGLFITDDKNTNILIPGNRSSNFASLNSASKAAVIRYRVNYGADTTLGWISTLRSAQNYQNQVHGIDARVKLNIHDVIKFQSLYSNTQYPENFYQQFCNSDNEQDCAEIPTESNCDLSACDFNENVLRTRKSEPFSGNAFKAGYYHTDDKWFYRATYNKQNAGFRGDLGFISKADYNNQGFGGSRRWYADPNKWWTQFKIFSSWDVTYNDNKTLLENKKNIGVQLIANYDSRVRLSAFIRDKVGRRFNKSSLAIKNNTTLFTENRINFFAEIKPLSNLYLNTRISYGDSIDFSNNRLGKLIQVTPSINWNVDKHLEFKLRHTYSQLNADNANVYNARLLDFRTVYQFNVRSFVRLTLIYDNTDKNPNNYLYQAAEDVSAKRRDLATELLYVYKINPQTVFYLGYTDHYDTTGEFSSLTQDQRNVYMKFSYAWQG